MSTASDQLGFAIDQLDQVKPLVFSAIAVLNAQGYTTPASDLQTALTAFLTALASTQTAVAAGTTG